MSLSGIRRPALSSTKVPRKNSSGPNELYDDNAMNNVAFIIALGALLAIAVVVIAHLLWRLRRAERGNATLRFSVPP